MGGALNAEAADLEELGPGYIPLHTRVRAENARIREQQDAEIPISCIGRILPPPQDFGLGLSAQTGSSSSSTSAPARPTPPTCSSLHELVSQHLRPPSPDNSDHMSSNFRGGELGEDDERHDVLPITVDDGDEIMPVEGWQDRDIEITLDSGCCNHVLDAEDALGYLVSESPGSRRGQNFIVGNGERVLKAKCVYTWRPRGTSGT